MTRSADSEDNRRTEVWPGKAYPDDLKLTDFNQPLPVRGKKVDVWEGGIHVPGFAWWPGHIKPKVVTDPVHIVDWFPTLAQLVGVESNPPVESDGVDLAPVLFAEASLPQRDLYWIWNQKTNRWALRYGDWKIVKYTKQQPTTFSDWQLFNLRDDPREQTDVSAEHPEVAKQLHGLFLEQRRKDRQTKPSGQP